MMKRFHEEQSLCCAEIFDPQELHDIERLFESALQYDAKGLKIAAEALRYQGQKALKSALSTW